MYCLLLCIFYYYCNSIIIISIIIVIVLYCCRSMLSLFYLWVGMVTFLMAFICVSTFPDALQRLVYLLPPKCCIVVVFV